MDTQHLTPNLIELTQMEKPTFGTNNHCTTNGTPTPGTTIIRTPLEKQDVLPQFYKTNGTAALGANIITKPYTHSYSFLPNHYKTNGKQHVAHNH